MTDQDLLRRFFEMDLVLKGEVLDYARKHGYTLVTALWKLYDSDSIPVIRRFGRLTEEGIQ